MLRDPVTNATQTTKMENTLGRMDCINKDQSLCKIDNI